MSSQGTRILWEGVVVAVVFLGILTMEHTAVASTPGMGSAGWRSIGAPVASGTEVGASTQLRPTSGYVHSGAMPQPLAPEPSPSRRGPVKTMPFFPIGKAHLGAAIGGGQQWNATGG